MRKSTLAVTVLTVLLIAYGIWRYAMTHSAVSLILTTLAGVALGITLVNLRVQWKTEELRRETAKVKARQAEDPFANSPFNADVIREGDPGWDIFEATMRTGGPVFGTYEADTGKIVSITDRDGKDVTPKEES